MEDLKEFYKIQVYLKDTKTFEEMMRKSKGLYYKNAEGYV